MFDSILDLWAFQLLGPSTLGSVMSGSVSWYLFKAGRVIGCPLPQSLCHTYPPHIPYARQTVVQRLYDWVGVQIPPLDAFSDHRIWPVQATYPLLLCVLAEVILVDSWEFPLHQVFT